MLRAEPAPRVLTVTQLAALVREALEGGVGSVWVAGEISNLRPAPSGHVYFTLKDEQSQLGAVMFRSVAQALAFRPADGMEVLVCARVSLYPVRGALQLYVDTIEPRGLGALQLAFEQLKARLGAEGLFAAARKRPLPRFPRAVGIVTALRGAVIHDMRTVLRARWPACRIVVRPVRVQGAGAGREVAEAIEDLNRLGGLDVLIVARGGGSLEDLWAFNDEQVARALSSSKIPTISAVGHETDFTIADFVADLRAPTPSAAAEAVVKAKEDLVTRIATLEGRLSGSARLRLTRVRARVETVTFHRVFTAERGRLRGQAQRVDELFRRGETGLRRGLERSRDRFRRDRDRLEAFRWDRQVAARRERLARQGDRLQARLRSEVEVRRTSLGRLAAKLDGLSPLAVLARGYALVWDAEGRRLLRDAADVDVGDGLRIRLRQGALAATVTGKEPA